MKFSIPVLALATMTLFGNFAVGANDAMYSCTNARGETFLTNVPTGGHCQAMVTPSTPTSTPAAAPAASPAQAMSTNGHGKSVPVGTRHSRQQARRNAVIKETSDAIAQGHPGKVSNRAVNRRYLITNRVDYIKTYGTKP